MDLGLKGKVALVTGASKGIGRAVAEALAAEGARVALVARDAPTLEATVRAVVAAGGEAVAVPGDVSDAADVERIVAETRRALGDPTVLVANAAGPRPGPPTALDDGAWAAGYDLTLMSAVRLARAVLPAMRRARWGRIINITSLTVREPLVNLTLSNAFRTGLTAYAKTLSVEVASEGITVNNLAPGYTATERLDELFADAAARRSLEESIPAGRFAEPAEVGVWAAFIASEQAAYLTGQSILVDGGAIRNLM